MSRHPLTKWAQRSNKVFITIELPDAKDVKLTLQPDGHFHFSAATGADNVPYEIDLNLYDKVNVDESKADVGSRNICYLVKKAENKWWNRLLKQEGKSPVYLKVDWDKWVDEDEQEIKLGGDTDFSDMDFSKLGMGDAEDDDYFEDDSADKDDEMDEAKTDEAPPAITESGASASSATN